MPSIEIVCVGQAVPLDFSYAPFTCEAEPGPMRSHRGPEPSLFSEEFTSLHGCIYHLGGPCLRFPWVREEEPYTAADLCTEWWEVIHFRPRFVPYVAVLLWDLLAASPEGRVLFTSDYQFGPSRVRRYAHPLTPSSFWRRHDAMRLHTNAAFWLVRGGGRKGGGSVLPPPR